jgi:hypothetical protein
MIAIYHVFVHNNDFVLLRKKLNSSMSNFGERLDQPSKMKPILFSLLFFCQQNSTGGGFLILKNRLYLQRPAKKVSHYLNVSVIKALIKRCSR